MNTRLPSGVNFSRLAPLTFAGRVAVTFLVVRSTIETVPSPAFATQSSFWSGETSKPSQPFPTGTTVSFQSPPGGPIGGRWRTFGGGGADARGPFSAPPGPGPKPSG